MNTRINQLDLLRGIAVLGILIMNIKGFALISAIYINPLALGPIDLIDWGQFVIERVFVDYKFLGIFSLLFGAGIALIDQKFRDKTRVSDLNRDLNRSDSDLFGSYRSLFQPYWYQASRLLVLALFGACHAFMLWYGDILLSYAICGFVVLFFVRLSPKFLFALAVGFALVPFWYFSKGQISISNASPESLVSMANSFWTPASNSVANEVGSYTGSWQAQFQARVSSVKFMLLHLFPQENFWKSSCFMLLGIALYQYGFFSGKWQTTQYLKFGIVLTVVGLIITIAGTINDIYHQFNIQQSLYLGRALLYLGSIPQAIGYAALFYYCYQRFGFFRSPKIAAVGRLALSNYIFQTLLCTGIFYGWGLGWYGEFDSFSVLAFVAFVWTIQIVLSTIWLKHFSQGPLETAWRLLASKLRFKSFTQLQ